MKKKNKLFTEGINIPIYMEIPTGIFRDINHYQRVVAKVTKTLAKGKLKGRRGPGSYLFNGIKIEFKKEIQHEEICLDHYNAKIILQAPLKPKESDESKRKRIMFYHAELIKSIEQMKVHGITSVYLALSPGGRKKLSR